MKVTKTEVGETLIAHCPWNPRPQITPESVSELAASIKAKGLLHDIGLMRIPDGRRDGPHEYWCIFGNRRLAACRVSGMESIPAKVFECTEAEGRELTRIENEIRLGVSPLEDAKLVQSMIDMGLDQRDISAHFGVSEATVCRRAKLIGLDRQYHAIVDRLTASALERIAMFPADIQARVFKQVQSTVSYYQYPSGWSMVSRYFEDELRNLDGCPWCRQWKFSDDSLKAKCTACMKRTGTQPDLWGDLSGERGGGKGCLGNCLDKKCFQSTLDSWLDPIVERRTKKATSRVKLASGWAFPDDAIDKPTKEFSCAYWWYDRNSSQSPVQVKWWLDAKEAARIREEEERRRERENRKDEAERKRVHDIQEKIDRWADEMDAVEFANIVAKMLADPVNVAMRGWLTEHFPHTIGTAWRADNINAELVKWTGGLDGQLTPAEQKTITDKYEYEKEEEN